MLGVTKKSSFAEAKAANKKALQRARPRDRLAILSDRLLNRQRYAALNALRSATSIRARPFCLATYNASSALRNISGRVSCCRASVTPPLKVNVKGACDLVLGSGSIVSSARCRRSTARFSAVFGRTTKNSSPPRRVTKSPSPSLSERCRAKWRQVSWRRGTKGRLVARFAAVRVRIADGAPQRIGSSGAQHMPGEEAWLVGEHRSNGERKYYLSNLPEDIPIKDLAGAIKARWICEQAHQQLKEELGLDHFEGRSWIGLHRHALMTMMAYAFLQSRRLAQAGRKKKSPRTAASAQPAGSSPSHP